MKTSPMIDHLGWDIKWYLESSQFGDRNNHTVLLDGCWCETQDELCLFELPTAVLVWLYHIAPLKMDLFFNGWNIFCSFRYGLLENKLVSTDNSLLKWIQRAVPELSVTHVPQWYILRTLSLCSLIYIQYSSVLILNCILNYTAFSKYPWDWWMCFKPQ